MGQVLRLILGVLLLVLPVTARAEQVEMRNFQVLRNGTPIGHHTVTIRRDGTRSDVTIDIKLRVTAVGVLTLYRYLHDSHEVWQGDRLVSLQSTTDNDGDQEYLNAAAVPEGLKVEGSGFTGLLPPETMPTSYWRSDFVRRDVIMDSQNGRRVALAITPQATEMASAARSPLPARRYHILGQQVHGEIDLTLWYDSEGHWVKAAFVGKDASTIEYLLQ